MSEAVVGTEAADFVEILGELHSHGGYTGRDCPRVRQEKVRVDTHPIQCWEVQYAASVTPSPARRPSPFAGCARTVPPIDVLPLLVEQGAIREVSTKHGPHVGNHGPPPICVVRPTAGRLQSGRKRRGTRPVARSTHEME